MAKDKLTVTTEFGTFTRTTARTYTHLVIVQGYKAERIEANRLACIADTTKTLAKYRKTLATGIDPDWRPAGTVGGDHDRRCTAQFIAEGRYAEWIADAERALARLLFMAPITQDRNSWTLDDANLTATPTFKVSGWCGRLDLAQKLAGKERDTYRLVAIIDVATGKVVL